MVIQIRSSGCYIPSQRKNELDEAPAADALLDDEDAESELDSDEDDA